MTAIRGLIVAGALACAGGCRRSDDATPSRPLPARPSPPTASAEPVASAPWPAAKPPPAPSDWCTEAVDALDEETCFLLPSKPTNTLLIYFHGIVPPSRDSAQKTNYQAVVATFARRAGVAALLPRGRQGLAPAGQKLWWGWPTSDATYGEHAATLMGSVARKRERLEHLAGAAFSRAYVAGSSSGAYFVAALALHGGIDADGFAILSGGGGRETPELARLAPKPVYIGYGSYDSVGVSARALGEVFRRAGWRVRVAEHPLGHGAREIYLDEALQHFEDGAGRP